MNNIKFKAACDGRVYPVTEIHLQLGSIVVNKNGQHTVKQKGRHRLLRFTGLTDINNVEVFEGDVVTGKRSSHWHEGFDKVKGIVTYRNETASFDVDSSSSKELMNGGSLWKTEELKVVGNIYEGI